MRPQPSSPADPTAILSRQSDDSTERLQACPSIESGRDDEVCQPLLHSIWRLSRQDRSQPRRRHTGSAENPRSLDKAGCTDNDHGVTARLAASFEQQRDIQRYHRPSLPAGSLQEARRLQPDTGMQDRFEPPQRAFVTEHAASHLLPVDRAVSRDPWERRFDRGDRRPVLAQQPVHFRIGIVHGNPKLAQHRGRPGFAHADRACDA
jgi:hypothetical protein